jgi:hypothetical protein
VLFAVEGRLSGIRLKGVDQAHMKRLIMKAIIKICAKSITLTTIIGVVIGIIGYINKWNSSITYSNAFFVAGCLLIIAGTSSRFAAGQGWNNFQLLNADSFRGMNSSERAIFIINASSPISLVILGVLSGILLILISAIAAYLV